MKRLRITRTLILLGIWGMAVPALAQIDRPSFFRDGQKLIEQEVQRLQLQQQQQTPSENLEHPSQLLTVNEGSLRWQKFIFRDGGFSVWMPEGISSKETVILETVIGQLNFEVFTSNPPSWRFVAAYAQELTQEQLQDPQALLTAVRDGIIQKTAFKLTGDRNIPDNQYPGKELSMQDGDESITFRVYLIGGRVYVLAAGQKNAQGISSEVVSFFDSFRLLK